MPQLNPTPWLMIFMLIWPFFMIMLNKTLNLICLNSPTMKKTEKKELQPWNWPWY